ncbi:MAG: serine hydrolase [Flavobacteriaceae bacterium]|nr:serine hydrolase [Flavobacteriaceae bacterium]
MKRHILLFLLLIFSFGYSQLADNQLDSLVKRAIQKFDVPGISLGIIENGKIIYAKGHGVRSINNQKPMNENTLVGIASNSKGFTCFAIGMLVDEGKINWDDKVRTYIPEFKMYDPFVSEEFTIRDLVTHRSGLSLGAGDLMFFPEGNDMSIDELIQGVSHLKPESSFRSKFRYNNNLYNIAGEVIRRVSGLEWAEFIEKRILEPVGMKNSKGSYHRVTDRSNIIEAHAPVNGKIQQIPHDWSQLADAAGGIVSNITDMLIWADFLMKGAVTKDGKQLLSDKQMHELWTLQTPIPIAKNNPYNSRFYGYGLGWFLSDVAGTLEVQHSGGLIGTVTKFTLLPDKQIGIVILTNQQSGAAFSAINNAIKDSYLGFENRDWIKRYGDRMDEYFADVNTKKASIFEKAIQFQAKGIFNDSKNMIGDYSDAWLGDILITEKDKSLWINFKNQPQLIGELIPYNSTTYIAKWTNRSFDADAFLLFNFDENGKATGFNMKPISDITDFSFDFVDLDVKRKKD